MMETLFQYYGIDWAALCFGLLGAHLISNDRREGFLFTIIACACGLSVAAMSNQYGYIVYNAAVILMMSRGIVNGPKKKTVVALGAE